MINKKLISVLAAMSLVTSVTVGFNATVSAASVDNSAVSVAEVSKGIELVYVPEKSTETAKVVRVDIKGAELISCLDFTVSFDAGVFSNVAFEQTQEFNYEVGDATKFSITANVDKKNGTAKWVCDNNTDGAIDYTKTTDFSLGYITFTSAEDVSFNLSLTDQHVLDYYFADIAAGADVALANITVPKYVTDPEPEPKPEAQAVNATMKHSQNDELSTENEAQYWLAEFTPTAAFNTLTVVATDVDGNTTAPVSKTETMVSGESSMFVQVLVKNVTKAVQSVVVTASVE